MDNVWPPVYLAACGHQHGSLRVQLVWQNYAGRDGTGVQADVHMGRRKPGEEYLEGNTHYKHLEQSLL